MFQDPVFGYVIGGFLQRSVRAATSPISWELTHGPAFANGMAVITIEGSSVSLLVERVHLVARDPEDHSSHANFVIHNCSDRNLIVGTLLSIAAVILVIVGVITVLSGSVIVGIV